MNTQIPVKNTNIAARILGDFTVVIDLGEERMFHELNETAAMVFSLCDGKKTVEEIITVMSEEYDSSQEELRTDVQSLLESLSTKKLISFQNKNNAANA